MGMATLTNLLGAVVFVVRLAVIALHTGLNLSTDTDTVSNFACSDPLSDRNDLANDFVSYAEGRSLAFKSAIIVKERMGSLRRNHPSLL